MLCKLERPRNHRFVFDLVLLNVNCFNKWFKVMFCKFTFYSCKNHCYRFVYSCGVHISWWHTHAHTATDRLTQHRQFVYCFPIFVKGFATDIARSRRENYTRTQNHVQCTQTPSPRPQLYHFHWNSAENLCLAIRKFNSGCSPFYGSSLTSFAF